MNGDKLWAIVRSKRFKEMTNPERLVLLLSMAAVGQLWGDKLAGIVKTDNFRLLTNEQKLIYLCMYAENKAGKKIRFGVEECLRYGIYEKTPTNEEEMNALCKRFDEDARALELAGMLDRVEV